MLAACVCVIILLWRSTEYCCKMADHQNKHNRSNRHTHTHTHSSHTLFYFKCKYTQSSSPCFCICRANYTLIHAFKVTHCPGPRLLCEKVHFNGRNQIGRPAHVTHICIVKTNSTCLSSHEEVIYVLMSTGNYFYSYIIIPATINHNNVSTITDD